MYNWTLSDMLVDIRKDCDLESEKNLKDPHITRMINKSIRKAESIIMNEFAGHYETYKDYNVLAGDTYLPVPADLYKTRIKFIQYSEDDPDNTASTAERYKVKKIPLENLADVSTDDGYSYRISNDKTNGLRINIYPPIRKNQNKAFRVYYIRQIKQLEDPTDICDIANINFILSDVKVKLMSREGHPMLEIEMQNLGEERENLLKDMTYLTDDGEDTVLGPNKDSMADWDEYQIG
jgi:hypothetical protein